MHLLCQRKERLYQLVLVSNPNIVFDQGNIRRYILNAHRKRLLIVSWVAWIKWSRDAWISGTEHAHRMHYHSVSTESCQRCGTKRPIWNQNIKLLTIFADERNQLPGDDPISTV